MRGTNSDCTFLQISEPKHYFCLPLPDLARLEALTLCSSHDCFLCHQISIVRGSRAALYAVAVGIGGNSSGVALCLSDSSGGVFAAASEFCSASCSLNPFGASVSVAALPALPMSALSTLSWDRDFVPRRGDFHGWRSVAPSAHKPPTPQVNLVCTLLTRRPAGERVCEEGVGVSPIGTRSPALSPPTIKLSDRHCSGPLPPTGTRTREDDGRLYKR